MSFKLTAHLPSLIAYLFYWKIMAMKFLLGIETLFWVMCSFFKLLMMNLIHCTHSGKRSYGRSGHCGDKAGYLRNRWA